MQNSEVNHNLNTSSLKTWCPGCSNFSIETAVKNAVQELSKEGLPKENFVLVSGIGCHAKIVDYINLNSFYSIHGRVLPVATGIKLANRDLKIIGFQGDGDAYNEGMEHLIFAAKRNSDITAIIHNNRTFALTTGQFTATSPKKFEGKSTPKGSPEEPLNPIELMLASRATFVARAYGGKLNHLKEIIKKAIKHKGFSFIDVLQPCVSFFDNYEFYNERVYDLESDKHDTKDYESALVKARAWDYSSEDKKIPIGIFYQVEKPLYEKIILGDKGIKKEKEISLEKILQEKI